MPPVDNQATPSQPKRYNGQPHEATYHMPYRHLLGLLTGLLLFTACSEQLDDLTSVPALRYDATFAIPLIDSEASLRELIGDVDVDGIVDVTVREDGVLVFRYSGIVPRVGPQIVFDRIENITRGIQLPLLRDRQGAPFNVMEDIDIDDVTVSAGQLFYDFRNPYEIPVRITASFPDANLNGAPLIITEELPAYSGTGPVPVADNVDNPLDLNGFILEVPNDSIYIEYSITDLAGNQLPIDGQSILVISDLEFSLIRGYLGQELYAGGRDTIEVDFFDNYLEGDISFADPTVTVRLTSTFGLPAQALVEVLQVQDVNGNVIPIMGGAVTDGFNFDFPTVPGEAATTEFIFNSGNSNIDEVLSARPVALDYRIDANINPDADRDLRGFITDSSFYQAEVDVDIPLIGRANNFTLRDTLELNLMDQYDEVDEVFFQLTTDNGLPFGVEFTGQLLDGAGNVIGDLTDGESTLLQPAMVDAAGNVSQVTTDERGFNFDGERIATLRAAERLVLTFSLATSLGGTRDVRITDDQRFRFTLGAQVRTIRE